MQQAPEPASDLVRQLPAVVAIPLAEYLRERGSNASHPLMALHRLCDAVEVLVRFATIMGIGELRRRGPLPGDLLNRVRRNIDRPTFGVWVRVLKLVTEELDRERTRFAPVAPELVGAWQSAVAPLAPQQSPTVTTSVVELRNLIAHCTGLGQTRAAELLRHWHPLFMNVLPKLEFLGWGHLCLWEGGAARPLVTSSPGASAPDELPVSADLRLSLNHLGLDGHVLYLRDGRWLDLWPLCAFGRPTQSVPPVAVDSPLVYYRAERRGLQYDPLLGGTSFVGLREPGGSDAVRTFKQLFRPTEGETARSEEDYDGQLRAEASLFKGRRVELEGARRVIGVARSEAIRDGSGRVLWLSGPGGIGKSWLVAKLASEALDAGEGDSTVVAWRFDGADPVRCNRTAFIRHALSRLLESQQSNPGELPRDPESQVEVLARAIGTAAGSEGGPRRVVFYLDGVDEIDRIDPGFADIPFRLCHRGAVWVCAGRPTERLNRRFQGGSCREVIAHGVPRMSDADIREILTDETGPLKYELMRLDRAGRDDRWTNAAVDAVVERAEGLPLYVRFVVEDVLKGAIRFGEFERLPRGLSAYYRDLLHRLGVGDLQALLTPLVVTLAWAPSPPTVDVLLWLLARRGVCTEGDAAILTEGLRAVGSLVRDVPIEKQVGYELYHETFVNHVRTDAVTARQSELAQKAFASLATRWKEIPADHPARPYALRYGVTILIGQRRWDDLESLLLDFEFLEAMAGAKLVYELAANLRSAALALPTERPGRRLLALLEEAIRLDLHFLANYPSTIFQCLWNRCWWYDCPAAATHYRETDAQAPWCSPGAKLSSWMERWRAWKEEQHPGFVWIRSLRPPASPLASTLKAFLHCHVASLMRLAVAADGRRMITAGKVWDEGGEKRKEAFVTKVWDLATQQEIPLRRALPGHPWDLAIERDGRLAAMTVGSGDKYRVEVWNIDTSAVLFGTSASGRPLALAHDGAAVAFQASKRSVEVWPVTGETGGRRTFPLPAKMEPVTLAFSPDSTLLAVGMVSTTGGMSQGALAVWDWRNDRVIRTWPGKLGRIQSVRFDATGSRIAAASVGQLAGEEIRVWDVASGELVNSISSAGIADASIVFLPGGRKVAEVGGGASGGVLRVIDLDAAEEQQRQVLRGTIGWVRSLAALDDGRLLTASWDGFVRVWDFSEAGPSFQLVGLQGRVVRIHSAPPEERLLLQYKDGGAQLWDAARGLPGRFLQGRAGFRWSLATGGKRIIRVRRKRLDIFEAPLARRLASVPADSVLAVRDDQHLIVLRGADTIRVVDAGLGVTVREIPHSDGPLHAAATSPDKCLLAAVGASSALHVWDAQSGQRVVEIATAGDRATRSAFSTDGRHLLVTAAAGGRRIIRAESWDQWLHVPPKATTAVRAVTAQRDGSVQVREVGGEVRTYPSVLKLPEWAGRDIDHESLLALEPGGGIQWAGADQYGDKREMLERERMAGVLHRGWFRLSEDSRRMARCADGGRVVVDDLDSGRRIFESASVSSLSQLVLSADGARLLIGDGPSATVWETDSGRRVGRWAGDTKRYPTFCFVPGSDSLIGLSARGMRSWALDPGTRVARCRLPRNVSPRFGGLPHVLRFSADAKGVLLEFGEGRRLARVSVVWDWHSDAPPAVIRWASSGHLAPAKKKGQGFRHWGPWYSQSWLSRSNRGNRREVCWGIGRDEVSTTVTVGKDPVAWHPDGLTVSAAISHSRRQCAGERAHESMDTNTHLILLSLEGKLPIPQSPTNCE